MQPESIPFPKKRRTNSNRPQDDTYRTSHWRGDRTSRCTTVPDVEFDRITEPWDKLINAGVTFADPSWGTRCDENLTTSPPHFSHGQIERLWDNTATTSMLPTKNGLRQQSATTVLNWDLGNGSCSHAATPMDVSGSAEGLSPYVKSVQESKVNREVIAPSRKRRRSGFTTASIGLTNSLTSLANVNLLGDGLLRIYQDSFETHLSCWLTEKICPYSKDCAMSLPDGCGLDWNRIYHRVFKLDQSAIVRGRPLSISEDRAASRALNLAIFSFASQWTVLDAKQGSRYPFCASGTKGIGSSQRPTSYEVSFNQALHVTAWHQAHRAVCEAAHIESFRVVLAHIVLSLTEKPCEVSEREGEVTTCAQSYCSETKEKNMDIDIDECDDLLGRLELTLNGNGPPLHLEQGLRLIHSLRSKMTMAGAFGSCRKGRSRCWKHLQASGLDAADRATVDLLFWLCIMFDTLSSAIHKRPLVVSLEDSDLPAIESIAREGGSVIGTQTPSDPRTEDLWDYLFLSFQRQRDQRLSVRWPFTENEAASLLCEAAPIKVLLFRKVTRIQTLLSRHVQSETVDAAVDGALEVYGYWQETYAPFLRDCIEHHADLTERVQSWHACLAGHWHLAALLLADLLDTLDATGAGCEASRRRRESLNFVARFREENCRSLSDVARCACSQQDRIMSQVNSDPFFIGHGALLSEPWSDVLIRAYATAGATLLQPATVPPASSVVQHDAFKRANDCVRALSLLGGRSDKASSAANILSRELSLRGAGTSLRGPGFKG